MLSEVKKLPKSEVSITIELTPAEREKYQEEATKQLAQEIEVPGFRKGQAPSYLIISRIGPEAFFQAVLDAALPRCYFETVTQHRLPIASKPSITIISKEPLKFEARAALLPEVTLPDVEKLVIPVEKAVITEQEIQEVIRELQKSQATYKNVDRNAVKGDRVEIDFEGFDDGGALLENTSSKSHPLIIGEQTLVPGFEDELVGMKKGEKKKFPVKFPSDYRHAPFRKKTVHFEVTVKSLQEVILPEITETFVEKILGLKKTPEEFIKIMTEDITSRKQLEVRRKRESALFDTLIKKAKMEVSPLLIEEEIDAMLETLEKELAEKGIKIADFMEDMKKRKRDVRKEHEPEAVKRVKLRVIVQHLFKTLKIEVTESEIDEVMSRALTRNLPDEERKIIETDRSSKQGTWLRVRNNLMLEKLLKRFLGESKV